MPPPLLASNSHFTDDPELSGFCIHLIWEKTFCDKWYKFLWAAGACCHLTNSVTQNTQVNSKHSLRKSPKNVTLSSSTISLLHCYHDAHPQQICPVTYRLWRNYVKLHTLESTIKSATPTKRISVYLV